MQTPEGGGEERECAVVACLGNIVRVSQCVWGHITPFNWIVLHQCQEVTRYVCRSLVFFFFLPDWCSLSLHPISLALSPFAFASPLQQFNTWCGEKSFSGFKHRQSMWEELGGSRYIKAEQKHLYASKQRPRIVQKWAITGACWISGLFLGFQTWYERCTNVNVKEKCGCGGSCKNIY